MKRSLIPLAIILVMLALPLPIGENVATIEREGRLDAARDYIGELSSAGDSGAAMSATAFMSQNMDSLQTSVLNSYASSGTHTGSLDLTDYLLSGWTLYNVTVLADSITAAPERETMGITVNDYIMVRNDSGQVTDALYQAFYNQPHDGRLENYTFHYMAPYYLSSLGDAYLGVRSNFSNSQTNTTGWITPFTQILTDTSVTHDCSADSAVLNLSTYYYVVVDGTEMIGTYAGGWYFNNIFWRSSSSVLGLQTGYRLRDVDWYTYSGLFRQEAELDYTYTPWNKTTSEPLVYPQPDDVSLSANSTALTGLSWTFASDSNITRINFGSSQSVHVKYNLTLRYKKTTDVSTDWFANSSGGAIAWNATTAVSYPAVSGSRQLNFTSPSSWTVTGLYNSSDASTNYNNYTVLDKMVKCTQMTNGTWTLTFTAHNHLTEIHLYDSSNSSELSAKCSILVDMDITSRIAEEDDTSVVTSSTNATIWKGGTSIWKPANESVADGSTTYHWNIDSTTSQNGLYTIEVFWANGTEAGYRITQIVVYYPTQLTAEDYSIEGYTENSFAVRAYFNDTFTPQGLNGTHTTLTYSFDGGGNTTMLDHNNGTWSALISTIGKNPGSYQVNVFAEGFALQNRSATIDVTLIHETQSLTIQWSDGNNITFVESTDLVVVYRRVNGQNVSDAIVNVTIGPDIWTLPWEPSTETYRITFNGTDVPPGFGTYGMAIQAWKSGHLEQSDNDQMLALREEPANLGISWSNGVTITYVESTILSISYTMSNSTPIPLATANVTIGTDTWILAWNSGTETYDVEFNGSYVPPGFGIHSLSIQAWKKGYEEQIDNSETLTLSLEPTSLTVSWSVGSNITYVQGTTLIARYRMSNGTDIPGSLVNVTIGTDHWLLTWDPIHEDYRFTYYGSDVPPGFGTHSLSIEAWKNGYEERIDNSETLVLRLEPTSLAVSWSDGNNITYVQGTTLITHYRMSNSSAIPNAQVNVTIGGTTWSLIWSLIDENYQLSFNGTDVPPGFGTHNLSIEAWKVGYQAQIDPSQQLILRLEPTNMAIEWSNSNSITYVEYTVLSVNFTMSNNTPIVGAIVNATIGVTPWILAWNPSTEVYEVRFDGDDEPPGIGIHSFTIMAWKSGYENKTDNTETLTIQIEPTIRFIVWNPGFDVTYTEYTTFSFSYWMSNGTAIPEATVNVTIGASIWDLKWNPADEAYQIRFNGSDNPPGFGTHNLNINAWKKGFQDKSNISQWLTLREEPTALAVSWSEGYNITYAQHTILIVNYTTTEGTAITNAVLNVTIGLDVWPLVWNAVTETYEATYYGSNDPPGLGTHNLVISAWKFGYEEQTDSSQDLIFRIQPTSLNLLWSNGNSIGYFEHTFLDVEYRMSNGTFITDATVNVTIGGQDWQMTWNATAGAYQVRFDGSDDPPGPGSHSLTIRAWKYGYQDQTDSSATLTLPPVPTSIQMNWTNGDNITYLMATVLIANYTMFNGTTVTGANINVTIGSDIWALSWNGVSETYDVTFNGDDDPPGLGTHALTINAWAAGFEDVIDSSQIMTLRKEPTSIQISWSDGSNITYVEHTTLFVGYLIGNGSAISSAQVNVTISGTTWSLMWVPLDENYQLTFNGTDEPPGFGTHALTVRSWKFGYESKADTTQDLIIGEEDTTLTIQWSDGDTISYLGKTTATVRYRMSDGTAIIGATVNVTIGGIHWILIWNATDESYQVTFSGSDNPPGLGAHAILIQVWKAKFQARTDSSQVLTINKEVTSISLEWSDGTTITFVEHTTLSVNYTMSNGSVIVNAWVNVTSGLTTWPLAWDDIDQVYKIRLNGSDNPPGFGNHGLTIHAWKFGYESRADNTQTLVIQSELGSIESEWLYGGTITYVEFTVLSVNFTMSNGTAVSGAIVNATIGSTTWDMVWHAPSETYQIQYNGSDGIPGFGSHDIIVNASKDGYDPLIDYTKTLIIIEEPSTVNVTWLTVYQNNISYFEYALLSVRYRMSNGTVLLGSIVNVTIGGSLWELSWNSTAGAYTLRFNGSDSPPGFGVHILTIQAWKYGYQDVTDMNQTLVMRPDPTTIHVTWTRGNDISYIEYTTLSVSYRMSNGSEILDASVVATTGSDFLTLNWNATAQAYQVTIHGVDDPPGLGTFVVTIAAQKWSYADQNINSLLTISAESTSLAPSWSAYTFDWVETVILSINYTDSIGTLIGDATQRNVKINGTLYSLQGTNGTYWIELDNTFGLGYHTVEVNISKHGYDVAFTDLISFDIVVAESTLTLDWTSLIIDYMGQMDHVNVSVAYTQDFQPLLGATVKLSLNGSRTYDLVYDPSDEMWHITLEAIEIGLGSWNATLTANKTGYSIGSKWDILIVRPTETQLLIDVSSLTIYYDETSIVNMSYQMTNGSIVPGGLCTLEIDGAAHAIVWQTDHWEAVLTGALLGEGTHHCVITTTALGYESITQEFDIVVLLLPTQLLLDTEFSQYENETLVILVQLNDTVHAALIDWANVLLIFEGAEYTLEYNSSQQAYRVNIWLDPTISPGIYTLTITAKADSYADAQVVVSLTVHAKTSYTLVIESPTEVTEDSTPLIEVIVSSDSEPVSELAIEIHILAIFLDGTQVEWVESGITNNQGIATIEFDISEGTTELEVWAEFFGSVSEWKAVSEKRIITVKSSAVDPISILTALLRDPVTLSLVVGTPSAAILVVLLRRRRIPTKMKALRPRGSEISIAPVTGTSVVNGFNIMQFVGSENLVYNMTRKGQLLIVDTIDSLADALEEGSSHILGRLTYLGSLGLVTSITVFPKSKGQLKAPSESAPGEDRLKQEIMTSDAGLTRANLSKALGISSAKVGSLVKDLLTSDNRFYEVREGKKRFIRYRNSE